MVVDQKKVSLSPTLKLNILHIVWKSLKKSLILQHVHLNIRYLNFHAKNQHKNFNFLKLTNIFGTKIQIEKDIDFGMKIEMRQFLMIFIHCVETATIDASKTICYKLSVFCITYRRNQIRNDHICCRSCLLKFFASFLLISNSKFWHSTFQLVT